MKIFYQITEETIRMDIEEALNNCIEDGFFSIPSEHEKEEFINDCIYLFTFYMELNDRNPVAWIPDYKGIVMDIARDNDYLTD